MMKHALAAIVVALSLAACGKDLTAPGTSSVARLSAGEARHDVYPSGSTITSVGDDGTTISVDRTAHTMSVNGSTLILTQEAADSVYNILLRMYVADQQATYVLSGGRSGGGVPTLTREEPPPECPRRQFVRDCDGSMSSAVTTSTMSATTSTISAPGSLSASLDYSYNPAVTCTDISLAIYNEMPIWRAAKEAVRATIGGNAANLLKYYYNSLPQLPQDPTTWAGWARLWAPTVALDLVYMNFAQSHIRLNFYAALFHAKNCAYGPSNSPGGGGNGPGGTCFVRIYYYIDTGEIIRTELLGCSS